jgi:hypothetical protein
LSHGQADKTLSGLCLGHDPTESREEFDVHSDRESLRIDQHAIAIENQQLRHTADETPVLDWVE